MEEDAKKHAATCKNFIDAGGLDKAIQYCADQRIDPPKCSLTAQSDNANRLRSICKNMLTDSGWWQKRLKIRAAREAEMEKMRAQWKK